MSKDRLHNISGWFVPVLSHRYSEKVFPDVQSEPPVFQFVLIAYAPFIGHHWKDPGSTLFAPSLKVFIYINKFHSVTI